MVLLLVNLMTLEPCVAAISDGYVAPPDKSSVFSSSSHDSFLGEMILVVEIDGLDQSLGMPINFSA